MNEMVKILYDELFCKMVPDNPFETVELTNKLNSFMKKWFPKTMPQHEDVWGELIGLCGSEQENAFAVGFRTSVKLLMNL